MCVRASVSSIFVFAPVTCIVLLFDFVFNPNTNCEDMVCQSFRCGTCSGRGVGTVTTEIICLWQPTVHKDVVVRSFDVCFFRPEKFAVGGARTVEGPCPPDEGRFHTCSDVGFDGWFEFQMMLEDPIGRRLSMF